MTIVLFAVIRVFIRREKWMYAKQRTFEWVKNIFCRICMKLFCTPATIEWSAFMDLMFHEWELLCRFSDDWASRLPNMKTFCRKKNNATTISILGFSSFVSSSIRLFFFHTIDVCLSAHLFVVFFSRKQTNYIEREKKKRRGKINCLYMQTDGPNHSGSFSDLKCWIAVTFDAVQSNSLHWNITIQFFEAIFKWMFNFFLLLIRFTLFWCYPMNSWDSCSSVIGKQIF